MAIQLNGDDFRKLHGIICRQAQWKNENGRIALTNAAFAGEQKGTTLRNRLHLSGSADEAANQFIEETQNFGQVTKGTEALAVLLRYLKEHVGVDDEEFIDELFSRYPLIKNTPVSPIVSPNEQSILPLENKSPSVRQTIETPASQPIICSMPGLFNNSNYSKFIRHWLFGYTAYEAGLYEEAVTDYTEALLPGNHLYLKYNCEIYQNRGHSYTELDEQDKAITDYSAAINLSPESGVAYHNRGWGYHKFGNHNKAIADYTKAIALMPNFALTFKNRGNAYMALGNNAKAVADYEQYLKLLPSAEDADVIRNIMTQLKQL